MKPKAPLFARLTATLVTPLFLGTLLFAGAAPALAGHADLQFDGTTIPTGGTFRILVTLHPSAKIYTTKIKLYFPANAFQVESFEPADRWIAITQPGYDAIQNTDGFAIKTSGYPGGVEDPVVFGTFTLSTKGTGQGSISVGDDSFLYDIANKNIITDGSVLLTVVPSEKKSVPLFDVQVQPKENTSPIDPATIVIVTAGLLGFISFGVHLGHHRTKKKHAAHQK